MRTLLSTVLAGALLLLAGTLDGNACSHESDSHDSRTVRVAVRDGSFEPAAVHLPAGRPVKLLFRLEGDPGCADRVIFPELGIPPLQLVRGREVPLELPPLGKGSYGFSCPMEMVRGTLVVH